MKPTPQPNGRRRYRISYSAAIRDEILRCQETATNSGRGSEFVAALRQLTERLISNPMSFGEPLYRLPALRLQIRCAIARPIYDSFGVSEQQAVVYLREIRFLD